MKREQLQVGKIYIVKHSSGIIPAKLVDIQVGDGYGIHRRRTRYICVSQKTDRRIEFRSAVKFLREDPLPDYDVRNYTKITG